ncbi:MAG: hypothetical protein JWP08_3152, partial [Bryobacterales bacterium]|nr:hypothetical protein [Bryobacterales bacterium]
RIRHAEFLPPQLLDGLGGSFGKRRTPGVACAYSHPKLGNPRCVGFCKIAGRDESVN